MTSRGDRREGTYLLELTRYVVLNPLRARMVSRLEDWPWSSYQAMIGKANVPGWQDADWLPSQFGRERQYAIESCRLFVMEGKGLSSPLAGSDPASIAVGMLDVTTCWFSSARVFARRCRDLP
ncbi:hypothetical protein ABTW62_12275, partial [Nitrosomonas halophila]